MATSPAYLRPIPDLSLARKRKDNYREYPLNTKLERNREALVDIGLYGIAGQSYYSRPNRATGDPLPGVAPEVFVRQSVAERLAAINYELQQSEEVARLLGGHVELYVDEGWRSTATQTQLYEKTFPTFLRKQNPDWTEAAVLKRRDQLIANPSSSVASPAPHATGAAVNVRLRYSHNDLGFVPRSLLPMGVPLAGAADASWPDYYEHNKPRTKEAEAAQCNRRVFYWVMRGALQGDDPGFAVNPFEWWHWSYGDQLWAALTEAPQAFFGLPPK